MNEETKRIELEFVNVYIVNTGEGYILIDTGIMKQWSRLEMELLQSGILPDHLKLVIITHGDFDHTGNCSELQRKYQVKIAMHSGDVEMVRTGIPVKRRVKGFRRKLFLILGRRKSNNFQRFEPDIVLENGQVLTEYGFAARVIHTPGHTKGSIAVLTTDGQLFIGDSLSNRRKLERSPYIENEKALHESLLVLKRIKARIVYPGHGKPFTVETLASFVV
jgi:hydroxyacylglutathione hydrolase